MIFIDGDIQASFETPEEATIFTLLCSLGSKQARFTYATLTGSEHSKLAVLLEMASDYLNIERGVE